MTTTITRTDRAAARTHLTAMFGRVRAGFFFCIWTAPNRRSFWFPTGDQNAIEQATDKCIALAEDGLNVYTGAHLCLKPLGDYKRGAEAEIIGLVGFPADVDVTDPAHKKDNLPPDETTALQIIEHTGIVPTVINWSGHGLQAWGIFADPWIFTRTKDGSDNDHIDEERAKAKALAIRWQRALKAAAAPYAVDSTPDTVRVLRVAGTVNAKLDGLGNPLPIVSVELRRSDGPLWRPDGLAAELPPLEEPRQQPASTARVATPTDLDDVELLAIAMRAKNGAKFTALWNGDTSAHGGDDSGADLALCDLLAFYCGPDPVRIDRLFRQSALSRDKWDMVRFANGDTYGQGTIKTALKNRGEFYSAQRPTQNGQLPPNHGGAGAGGASGPNSTRPDGSPPAPPVPSIATPDPGTGLTDLANAERFIRLYGQDVHYVPRWKCWLVWDGHRWTRDDTRRARQLGIATVRAIYAEAADKADDKERQAVAKHAIRSEAAGRISAMLELAESLPGVAISPDVLDTDAWLLNCLNGTIELRSGDLLPHTRDHFITKLCPVVYDKDATAPTWTRFLYRIMDDNSNLIGFLQRAAGYSLCGDTGEECIFLCYGTGRNGKSKFLGALEHMLGDYAKPTKPDVLMERKGQSGPTNDLADLAGARFVPTIETGEGGRLAEALLKWMTGGDVVKARHLYSENFEFRPSFKIWLASNHKPIVRGSDEGIWSRLKLIPFAVTIPKEERDRSLAAKLEAEATGILAWAVQGCIDWQIHGLGEPKEVQSATDSYREEMDLIASFIADRCVTGTATKVSAKALRESYHGWCEANGEHELGQRPFGEKLTEKGFRRAKGFGPTKAWGWHGIGLSAADGDR